MLFEADYAKNYASKMYQCLSVGKKWTVSSSHVWKCPAKKKSGATNQRQMSACNCSWISKKSSLVNYCTQFPDSSHTLSRWFVEYSGGETSTLCRPEVLAYPCLQSTMCGVFTSLFSAPSPKMKIISPESPPPPRVSHVKEHWSSWPGFSSRFQCLTSSIFNRHRSLLVLLPPRSSCTWRWAVMIEMLKRMRIGNKKYFR